MGIEKETLSVLGNWWQQIQDLVNNIISGLPNFIAALVVLGIFWYLAKFTKRFVSKFLTRLRTPHSVISLFSSLVRIAVVAMGIMTTLSILSLDKAVTSVLAGLGIIGVALGFAFQDIVANFVSGVFLIFKRPFREGDVVSIAENEGIIRGVELRTTIIESFQGKIIHIPNKQVFQSIITNFSEKGIQRIDLKCGVGYDSDLETVHYVTLQALRKLDYVLDDPQPALHYEEFGGSSINFMIRFWIDYSSQIDFLEARSEALKQIISKYREHHIIIPFPITAIDLAQQKSTEVLGYKINPQADS